MIAGRDNRPLTQDQIRKLYRDYEAWHWGEPAKFHKNINDELVPHVIGIGKLVCFEVNGDQEMLFPDGCWLAFDKRHPHERIHVVTTPAFRESVRIQMKSVRGTVPIQQLAVATRGTHAKYRLPNVHGAPLGVLDAVVYYTHKKGDPPSEYHHEFGKEHSKGIKPVLAADVSGRLWVCGGSYTCPLAGITG